jgi:hypothetical protein
MKVFQKILSHGLLISFFVAVFFLYLYRAALFPQWFDDSAETNAGSAVTSEAEPPDSSVVAPEQTGSEPERDAIGSPAVVVQPPSASSPATNPVQHESGLPPLVVDDETASSDSGLPPLVADESAPVSQQGHDEAIPEVAPVLPAETVAVPAEQTPPLEVPVPGGVSQPSAPELPAGESTEPPAEALQADVVVPAEPAGDSDSALPAEQSAAQPESTSGPVPTADDYQSQLFAARELYWKRDAEAAVTAYTQLLQSYPDRADGWGELGNLYMAFGQTDNAVNAYSQAVELFTQQDRRQEASNMLGVMRTLNPARAIELGKQLEQAER